MRDAFDDVVAFALDETVENEIAPARALVGRAARSARSARGRTGLLRSARRRLDRAGRTLDGEKQ
jgi:hypothetical protein